MFQAAVEILSTVFVGVLSLNALLVPPLVLLLLWKNGQCDRKIRRVERYNSKVAAARLKARSGR